jgi:diadenosine tetraphosphatase ApaH/serine/threonine PP2A family protein phosphatase
VRGLENMNLYSPGARESLQWTVKQLTQDNKNWLDSINRTFKCRNFMLVHGSPGDPINEYMHDEQTFKENIPLLDTGICFIGHTHISEVFSVTLAGDVTSGLLSDEDSVKIKPFCKYVINCGSVGQPRGGLDNRASFGIYDDKEKTVVVKKLLYDIRKAQQEILEAGLPEFLARRLEKGI